MQDCVFCKIVSGEIPDYRYFEDEHAIAFLDIEPKVPGHSLVLPKRHAPYLFDMKKEEIARLFSAAKDVAEHLRKVVDKERICVIVEGFAVPHTHIHLVPANTPEEFATPAKKGQPDALRELQARLISEWKRL